MRVGFFVYAFGALGIFAATFTAAGCGGGGGTTSYTDSSQLDGGSSGGGGSTADDSTNSGGSTGDSTGSSGGSTGSTDGGGGSTDDSSSGTGDTDAGGTDTGSADDSGSGDGDADTGGTDKGGSTVDEGGTDSGTDEVGGDPDPVVVDPPRARGSNSSDVLVDLYIDKVPEPRQYVEPYNTTPDVVGIPIGEVAEYLSLVEDEYQFMFTVSGDNSERLSRILHEVKPDESLLITLTKKPDYYSISIAVE
jgi:hypothetical protein